MTKLQEAAQEYIGRQDRRRHPAGKFDKGGRWYPGEDEECSCCRGVRSPSRAYPYSLMVHCRTIGHVAQLYGVDEAELRREVRKSRPARREGGEQYYKAVAVVDGEYISIYDGETRYQIGVEMTEAPRQRHKGGYYVYTSLDDAMHVEVPAGSVAADRPRAYLRVRAEGRYCRYGNKLAFARITPIEVVQVVQS